MQNLEKDYKDYRKKFKKAGKKAVELMQSQPLSPKQSIEMLKKNRELATQMLMDRLNN